jgi:hypothetical protein
MADPTGKRPTPPAPDPRIMEQQQFRDATDRVAEALGISLARLAEGFGVNASMLTHWRTEGGRYQPREGWRVTLAGIVRDAVATRRRQVAAGERLAVELDPDGSAGA